MQNTQKLSLFLVVLGGRADKANVELHDVRWVIGSKIEDTFDALRRDWFGTAEGLHIDSYKKINYVDGYKINLKNFENKKIKKNIGYFLSKQIFKKQYSFSLNFKETTNLGRHFVFAQLKIPVISDYTISSSNFINHMKNSILAYDAYDWYESLKFLIENKNKSKNIGIQFYNDWKKNFSHEVLNKKLLDFFKNKNVK